MSKSQPPEPVSDELLSAYVDGELSLEESQPVERWLESSSAARKKVAELRRLSLLIHELPQEELPAEFVTAVMQQAERQMLLPAQQGVRAGTRWRKARFWTLSVGLPAAAACLLIAIQWNRPGSVPDGNLPNLAGKRAGTTSNVIVQQEAAADARKQATIGDETGLVARNSVAPAMAPAADSSDEVQAKARNAFPTLTTDQSADRPETNGLAGSATAAAEQAVPISEDSIQSIVRQVSDWNDAGRLPVVRIFVVDRRDGLEFLQVMLEGHRIARGDGDEKEPVVPPENSPERRALFVVANARDLTEALQGFQKSSGQKDSWKISEPVEMARFEKADLDQMDEAIAAVTGARPEPQSRIVAGVAAVAQDPSRDRAIASAPPRTPARADRKRPKRDENRRDVAPSERPGDSARDKIGLADVPIARANPVVRGPKGRQVVVNVGNTLATDAGTSPTQEAETGAVPSKVAPGEPLPATPSSRVKELSPAVRVLFVIEHRAGPEAVPAERKVPGDGAA